MKNKAWLKNSFYSVVSNNKKLKGILHPEDVIEAYLYFKKEDPQAKRLVKKYRQDLMEWSEELLPVLNDKKRARKAKKSSYKRVKNDVTERKETEEAIRYLNDFLWAHLGYELTDEWAERTLRFFNRPEEDLLMAVDIVKAKQIPIEYRHQYLCGVLKNLGKPIYKRYK